MYTTTTVGDTLFCKIIMKLITFQLICNRSMIEENTHGRHKMRQYSLSFYITIFTHLSVHVHEHQKHSQNFPNIQSKYNYMHICRQSETRAHGILTVN